MKIHGPGLVKSLIICVGAFAFLSIANAQDTTPPFVGVSVDGKQLDIGIKLQPTEKGWQIPSQTFGGEELGWQFTISGNYDTDPSIAYGLAVVDFGAPSAFAFLFGTPIVPVGPGTVVNSSIVGGLTDFAGDGVSITPTGAKVQSSLLDASPMGVDVGPADAHPAGDAGALYAYGPYTAGPIAGPAGGPFTFLTASASFSLSGGGDIAALTGFAQAVDAPATTPDSGPGVLGLVAIGLVLAGGAASRRSVAKA
jgi:hypothetical protein